MMIETKTQIVLHLIFGGLFNLACSLNEMASK